MTAASVKLAHPLTRLHLGCGESLSQLLPSEPAQAAKPLRPLPAPRKRRVQQTGGGDK